jgi:hypothetical protein
MEQAQRRWTAEWASPKSLARKLKINYKTGKSLWKGVKASDVLEALRKGEG